MRFSLVAAAIAISVAAVPAAAHPVPFSFVDITVAPDAVTLSVVAHAYDLSHDLGLDVNTPGALLEPAVLQAKASAIGALVAARLRLTAGDRELICGPWSSPEGMAERQSVRVRARCAIAARPGSVGLSIDLFPYDPEHRTFVNVYEDDDLRSQAILGGGRRDVEYFSGSRQGTLAVLRRFIPSGVHHILIGPDHLLFLVGLLLLGGTMRQLVLVVTGFTVAHSITLSLAALNIVTPPARLIEPAIALSIVYVGIDNLMVRDGRDVRVWIAFGFGLIHGFGFANILREMDLPARALGWSLFSFNVGVEIGQLCVVALVASALAAVRARSVAAGRRMAFAGSLVVIAAGAFWFVERVFFPGGST